MPSPTNSIGSKLRSSLIPEWSLIVTIFQYLLPHFLRRFEAATYEILKYETTLELHSATGKKATLTRQQRVKFLQDHVIAFQDHAWGEGNIFADYEISPGVEVDRYRDGDRWNVLISLRETKGRGDIEDFFIKRTIHDGFGDEEEWWQVEVWYQTNWLKHTTIFPKSRHCQRAVLHTRSNNKTEVLEEKHFHLLPDGRQVVVWEKKPRRAEVYTLKWIW